MKKISILGAGRWASCIAYILDSKKYSITMWQREESTNNSLFVTRKNQYVTLPKNINLTHNLKSSIDSAEVIIISIYSQNLQDLMNKVKAIKGYQTKKYCLAMKGIECSTGRRLSEILLDNGVPKDNIAVWAGPGHIQSLAKGGKANMLISAYNSGLAKELAQSFSTKNINLSISYDIIGTELGAAAKNVYGIASGILQANPEYAHCIGGLMVASVKEMSNLIDISGGKPTSAVGLAMLGDYQATMFDDNSKNLTYGKTIIKQNTLKPEKLKEIIGGTNVEGIKTCEALLKLKNQFNSKRSDEQQLVMPICEQLQKILIGKTPLSKAGDSLFKTICLVLNN